MIPLVFITGPSKSGKSEFSRMLAKHLGAKPMDTSQIIIERLAELKAAGDNVFRTKSWWISDINANKEYFRNELICLGNMLCDANPAYLAQQCVKAGAGVIAGVRRECEYWAIRDNQMHPDQRWFLIRRPGHEKPDNFELEFFDYTIPDEHTIYNTGSLDELDAQAKEIAETLA